MSTVSTAPTRYEVIATRMPALFDRVDFAALAFPIQLRVFLRQDQPVHVRDGRQVRDYVFLSDRVATWTGRVPFGDKEHMVHFSDDVEFRTYAEIAQLPQHTVDDMQFAYVWAQLPSPVPDIRFHCTMMSTICGEPYVQLQPFVTGFTPEQRAAVAAYWGRIAAM